MVWKVAAEARRPAASINYGFVTYYICGPAATPLRVVRYVAPSHDVVSSSFEVTPSGRDRAGRTPAPRRAIDQKGDVPFIAVAGCEGTGHALLRNPSIDEWSAGRPQKRRRDLELPHSQPGDERRPNFAVAKPDFIGPLARARGRRYLAARRSSAATPLWRGLIYANADALFEQLFALTRRHAASHVRSRVARPADTVRGLARFLGQEPKIQGEWPATP